VIRLLFRFFRGFIVPRRIGIAAESGVATTEFALCCPLLVLVITGALDYAAILSQYGHLEEAVHEGIRYAASLTTLEGGRYQGLSVGTGPECLPSGSSVVHEMVQNRVADLIRINSSGLNLGSLCMRSEVTTSAVDSSERLLTIEAKIAYNGFFPGIQNLPLKVTAMGPVP
jgi:hypothetical protein